MAQIDRGVVGTESLGLGPQIEGVAVAFAGLFLAQAMAALPSHNYAMPVNAFVLVLLGVIVEFFARAVLRLAGPRASNVAVNRDAPAS